MSDAFEKSMELCGYIGHGGSSHDEVERLWRQAFEAVLMRERFTRRAIDYMWDNLVEGNWERLHQTDEEKARTEAEWLDWFHWEVFYCSDRWSLDRLSRCHWLYRQWRRAKEADDD